MNAITNKQNLETHKNSNSQIQELQEENEIIYKQLHVVQEELERYYYKLKEVEKYTPQKDFSKSNSFLYAENIRLTNLVKAYKNVRTAERKNSMQARVGAAFIKLSSNFLTAPLKFLPTLLFFIKTTPPAALGGKDFSKVIEAYELGKIEAVKKIVASVHANSVIKANAYTAVAKYVQRRDLASCVELAYLAYSTDPCDYRLKWWILRLEDFDDVIAAEALLELLPDDAKKNDTEKNKIAYIRWIALQRRIENSR